MKKKIILSGCFATVLFFMFSCKGRTMENMEPTGDTVEVNITKKTKPPVDLVLDSSNYNLNKNTDIE